MRTAGEGTDTCCSRRSTLSTPAHGQSRWTRPETYFANAVLAEVFIVAENDNFAGHGCTDAEPVLDLKSIGGKRSVTGVYSDCGKRARSHPRPVTSV